MPEERDRVTVGITPTAATALERLMETGWFRDEMDAYRLAIAAAIAAGLEGEPISGAQTKYNVGTLDRDGRMRDLLVAVRGSTRPYEDAERLANTGLALLRDRLVDRDETLAEALGFDRPKDADPGGQPLPALF